MRERNRRIELLEKGEVRCLVNSDIATVGFNVKKIDAMLILRKVLSIRLHQQMLGRGVRLNFAKGYDLHDDEQRFMAALEGGKENCLVLDFAGNLKTLGPIQEPFDDSFSDPSEVKKKSARMRDCPTCKIKVKPVDSFCLDCGYYFEPDPGVACPSCEKVVAANSRFCRFCEHPFIEINQNPTTNMELDDKTPDEAVYNVRYASFKYHEPKNGGAPGIMVNVFCYSGQKLFFWLSYKNNGASYFARESWKILSNVQRGAPRTIGEARARINELKCPKRLKVKEKGKFKTIVGADHG